MDEETATLANQIHAILFTEGDSVRTDSLEKTLGVTHEALLHGIQELTRQLAGTGLSLIQTDRELALAVSPRAEKTVQDIEEKNLRKDIGEAGLEVLAILLYDGPSTRARIDFVRGVNTSTTIRNLLSRGLIERSGNPLDGREYMYRPTTALLAHLGVSRTEELPDYGTISSELGTFKEQVQPNGPFGNHDTATDSREDAVDSGV